MDPLLELSPPRSPPVAGSDFSPEEWLALLPSAPPDLGPLRLAPGTEPTEDPRAAALRKERPLTRSALLSGLAALSPPLRTLAQLQFAAQPFGRRFPAAIVFDLVLIAALLPFVWLAGVFGTIQFAVGTAALFGLLLAFFVSAIWSTSFRSRFTNAVGRTALLAGASAGSAEPEVSNHALAAFVRYQELKESRASPKGAFSQSAPRPAEYPHKNGYVLLEHDSGDPMCPCDLPSCAGKLPRQAVYWRLAWVVTLASLNYALFLFFAYTPFVTLRATFWNTAWCAAAAAIYCAFNLVFYGIMANARFSANVSALSLGSRLSHRAIAASLRSLLSRLHTALEAGRTADVTSALASSEESDELYVRLHTMLVRAWRSRITTLSSGGGSFLVLYFGTSVVCAVANIAAGNCIPGYGVVIFSLGIFNVLWDIIHFAVSNSGVDGARRLYLAARTDLRKVLARLPVPLDPARAEWAAKVEHHERLLSAFAEVDDCRSRFLGFAVTYGTARTLVVTGLTVFVGLYSILRGVGVRVVGDFACPPL